MKSHFLKANFSALAATAVDYGSLLLSVEVLHIHYSIGVALGAFLGAITNFSLNRKWTFKSSERINQQILKYALVSAGSLILNTGLVVLTTESLHLQYFLSKIIVSLVVAWGWNYPLQKNFVFRK
jgi:putative flippase GtrA